MFVGDGLGIPGIPHRVTEQDAEAMGVLHLLRVAIEHGSYVRASEVNNG